MASNYVCMLCGARFYSDSNNSNIASHRTDVFLASAVYS